MSNICNICPNNCNIHNNTICREIPILDNENIIYTSKISVDPIEKNQLYHYLPGTKTLSVGTVGCNLQCLNCKNYNIAQPKNTEDVIRKKYSPTELVSQAKYKKVKSILWTYNEPTIHPKWIAKTAQIAKEHDIKTVLITNGYNSQDTLDYLVDYVDAVNIDIKGINNNFYKEVCHGNIEHVLNTIEFYYKNNIHIELTNLLIPGYNDDREDILELIDYVKSISKYMPLHFKRFLPRHKLKDVKSTPDKVIDKAIDLAKYKGLNYVYPANTDNSYKDNTYCRNCRHLIIKRENDKIELNINENDACLNCNHKIDIVF